MAFCYGSWVEMSKAGIPEMSLEAVGRLMLNLMRAITHAIPIAPKIATWVFLLACINFAFPNAYKSIPSAAWQNSEYAMRMLGVYVIFWTLWSMGWSLLADAVKAYHPLPNAMWMWLSLIIVVVSILAVIASVHYTNAFWQPATTESQQQPAVPELRETSDDSPTESFQPDDEPVQPPSVRRRRRPDLNYPAPGSYNRALAFIPVIPDIFPVPDDDVSELATPEEPPRGWLVRIFKSTLPRWLSRAPPTGAGDVAP